MAKGLDKKKEQKKKPAKTLKEKRADKQEKEEHAVTGGRAIARPFVSHQVPLKSYEAQ
ncbi:MAG: hypothetical protein NVV67_13085 [Pseudoxanthomonas sp.]|nr:hypothetical protein [Pseudoxanthomonas sp.]